MSGAAVGECKELKSEESGFPSSGLEPQDILLAHEILSRLGRPLSWKDLHDEFSKLRQGGDWQILKDAFCSSKVIGFIMCEDFISLDTVEMIALLKLQLIVVICEKLKSGRLSMISFLVNATVTEEEKRHLGRDPMTVAKVVEKYEEILKLTGSSFVVNCTVETTDKTIKFLSFFCNEKSSPILSAIHKIKYFLNLCRGKSSTSLIFEFVQNFLTPNEKVSLGKTKKLCMRQIQVSQDEVNINGETVELLPPHRWLSQPRKTQTLVKTPKMDVMVKGSGNMNSPAAEQISLAKSVLLERGKPLSWEEFSCEYSKFKPGSSTRTLQDTFCQTNVAGLFASRDFISLDTPKYIGLLKLQLVVEIHERFKDRKFSKVRHKFWITATEEERDCYGGKQEELMNSMCTLPGVFCFSSSKDEVYLPSDYTPKQNSFFMYEGDDARLSAIHKLKYFLYLSHGSSSDSAFFEFSRCLLTKEEKKHYSGNACGEVLELIKSLNEVFEVVGSTVKLVQLSKPKQQVQNVGKVCSGPSDAVNKSSKTKTAGLQQDNVLLLQEMLKDGPLSWNDFADEYAKHRPAKSIEALQETVYQSSPNGFLFSPDFISLHNSRSVALLKLQLIVVADNRLHNEQLGKISYHFNVSASDHEREHFGRNSQQLGDSLEKLSQLFSVLDNGSHTQDSESKAQDLKKVKPSSKTLLFHSFFSEEGDDKTSSIHKLQYFINLCGGKSSSFSLFEFARNLLKGSEKTFFKNEKESFVQTISNMHNHFQVLEDEIKLHLQSLWHHKLKKMTQMAKVQEQEAQNKIQKVQACTATQPAEELTAEFVKNVLNNVARYPMDWNEFKTKFLKSKQNADAMITNFLQNCPQKALKSLCFSSDFLALNTPFHRNRLKLQLILAIRRKSTKPSLMSLTDFKMQFDEIASEQEIEQTELNCEDFRGFLDKFPRVFVIQKDSFVKQGREALQFQSFFQHEKDGPLVSVVHKLNYFVYLCGDYCSISLVCKFLQRHLILKKELELGNTDEKVLALIQKCESGALNLDGDEDKESLKETESDEERKATAADKAREVEDVLKTQNHAICWKHLGNLCFTKNKSKDWVSKFRLHYLPVLDSDPFICSREFISLNSTYDRVFLKLCLLVNLYVMKKGQCELQPLFKGLHSITSGVERKEFYVVPDYQAYLSKHPLVFKLDIKASGTCYVSPGEGMVSFADFFTCEDHHKEGCLHCQVLFFMKVCNGRSHYQKCHNFVQILLSLNGESDENGKSMSTQEVDDFIQKCGITKENENSEIYVIMKPVVHSRNEQANDTSRVSCAPEKNCQQLEHSTEGNSQSSSSTQGNSASSSTSKVNLQSVPPKEDCPQPSPVSQEAESTPLKSAEVTLMSSCNNTTSEINRLVKVKIVRTDKILSQVIDRMLKFERPIISMVHREDALVILNWEGKGFVIPFKKTDLVSSSDNAFAQKWSLLGEFFQNPTVTQVTFDCHTIGRFLLENFNLQLNDTVFDVKIGAQLLPSACNPTSVNNVADLCRCLNLPSLDKVDVQIVGDLVPKQGEEMVTLEKSSVEEAVREASALIPGIYGKMFQSLQEMDALKALHILTGEKLQSLYSMNIDSLLPLDKYYTSELTDTEPMKQSSSQSSISTGSSVPVSSVSLSGMVTSQIPSAGPVAEQPPSGYSEVKGLAEDWFSADVDQLPTIPAGIKEIFNQNQFSMKPSLTGTPFISYLQNQAFPMESLTTQSLPQGFMSNQQPDFEPSMLQDQPFSLCKDEAGSIIQVPVEEAGIYDQNLSGITEQLLNDFASQHKESMRQLLRLLGMDIFETLQSHYKEDFFDSFNWLTDIVLDLGRNAEARLFRHTKDETPETVVASSREVTAKDLAEIEKTDTLTGFGDDNRCGVKGTLHSLRQVRNKKKRMVGLTVRVHKPLLGCADMMYDIALHGKSTLIIGYSGVGKTTLLRELARCLNDSARKRVIVIDTYNEIGGDYDVPHFSIGVARRLQVDSHDNQYKTLLESAKNHSPEVLIVDEIESQNDVAAVVKLCQQGIQVIAGVDTESISNLFSDKNFYQLFQNGGDNRLDDSVSLDSAGALAKSKVRPSFQALVEMVGCNRWYVHDLAHTYNCWLSGQPYSVQERTRISFKPGQVGEQQIVLKEKLIV